VLLYYSRIRNNRPSAIFYGCASDVVPKLCSLLFLFVYQTIQVNNDIEPLVFATTGAPTQLPQFLPLG
jgi:hypothetical protein